MTSQSTSLQLASSAASARPGQLIALGRRGDVISQRRLNVQRWVLPAVGTAAMALANGVTWGAVYAAAYGAILYSGRHYRAALVALADYRDEDALALVARARRALVKPSRGCLDAAEGSALWRLGRLPEALAMFDRVVAARRGKRLGMMRWMASRARVQLLLAMGEVERARALRSELADAPGGEVVRAYLDENELMFAFASEAASGKAASGKAVRSEAATGDAATGDADAIMDDDRLHEWASQYLGWESAGSALQLLLAWAFQRRGDREMAGLCLHRSEETAPSPHFLARVYPALDAWRREHRDELLAAMPALDE